MNGSPDFEKRIQTPCSTTSYRCTAHLAPTVANRYAVRERVSVRDGYESCEIIKDDRQKGSVWCSMSIQNDQSELLDRDTFRESILRRDGYKCVLCGRGDPLNAHHIVERRLWEDGGYYMDNGATLCDDRDGLIGCHKKAEQTIISCDEVRAAARITRIMLPDHLYRDNSYDKWANIVMPDGTRIKGELFHDESVQKVLTAGGALSLFRDRVKYPRTYHLRGRRV
jgi:hypothetical protein